MTLPEAIEAAGRIIDCYPNGGANAGDGYIGALAAMLASYPKQVADGCADRVKGVTRDCRFLPTVADIVAWCERATAPLYRQADQLLRREQQLIDRAEFEQQQTVGRRLHLNLYELKEKYGDWHDNWRPPGLKAQELYAAARAKLVAEIGEVAFQQLPEIKQ